MNYETEIDNLFDVARDSIGRKIPDEYLADFLIAVNTERKKTKQALIELVAKARVEELSKVMGGTNNAAGIRTPAAGARNLNLDDLHYYLHNRKRVLRGEKAHTPEEWFEAVR